MFYLTAITERANYDAVALVKQLQRKEADGRREGENSALSVLT